VLVEKFRNENYVLSESMELVKVDGYGFAHPCDGPEIVISFLSGP
jgi:hypothetical protein